MRRWLAILIAAGMSIGSVAVAHAGTLTSATLQITLHGQVFNVQAAGATGNSTATSATLGAGSAFATTQTVPAPAPATETRLVLSDNSAVTATPGAVSIRAPVRGALRAFAASHALILFSVPIEPGGDTFYSNGSILGPFTYVTWGPWQVGQAKVSTLTTYGTVTGITHVSYPNAAGTAVSTAAQTRLTATGSFNLTPGGAGTVTLVSIAHVVVSGADPSDTASPTYLTLTYATPEPGTLLLLGAGAAGLALAGRRKRRG